MMRRNPPWIIRVLIIVVLVPFAFFFFGVGAFFEWLLEGMRR